MAALTKEQLKRYLNFINKCVSKNYNITPEELELLDQMRIISSVDKNTKRLMDALIIEQSNLKREKIAEQYLSKAK